MASPLPAPPTPPPPPPPPVLTPPEGTPRFADTERRWLVPTLLVLLVAISLGVAGLLLQRSGSLLGNDDPPDTSATTDPPAAVAVALVGAQDFDPEELGGDGEEHPDEVQNVIDEDPATAWQTSSYRSRDWGRLKPGVGLFVELEGTADIATVEIRSPFAGWAAEIYVADEPSTTLDGWGEPVATIDNAKSPKTTAKLDEPTSGGFVLVWLTTQGEGFPQMQIDEIRVER
jgi:hypothetical protein